MTYPELGSGQIESHEDRPIIHFASQHSEGCAADEDSPSTHDAVNRPKHYVSHPSGIECIQITEHMGFNLGNALKYVWRADLKHNAEEDLRKAIWYIERELVLRGRRSGNEKD